MKYSIIIPVYNKFDEFVKPCLDSVIKYTDLDDCEIIVVANGCTDNTVGGMKEYSDNKSIKMLWFKDPLGFPGAVNAGIKFSSGQYVILLNSDTVIVEHNKNEWIQRLVKPFLENPKTAVTGPLKTNGSQSPTKKHFIVFYCAMISKKIIDRIGLLDERFNPGGAEDIDYCIRCEQEGFETVQVSNWKPGMTWSDFPVIHTVNGSVRQIENWDEIFANNLKKLEEKYKEKKKEILCSISTRGRYDTTLPLTLQSVIMQTKKPDHLIIFDDNDDGKTKDLRQDPTYQYLFILLNNKNITWEVIFGQKKGQHYNHDIANHKGYNWVWRIDDDCVPEPDVLEKLYEQTNDKVGAVGGSVLVPPEMPYNDIQATGKIEDVTREPNLQWGIINETKSVDHLHCSFLYRAGVAEYNLALSKVAHREETLFTYSIKRAGYDVLITPCITWHLRNKEGGIRDGKEQLFAQDEAIFQNTLKQFLKNRPIVVLNGGLGDHIVFKKVLKDLKDPIVYSCYNNVIPGQSIGLAMQTFGDLSSWDIYRKMDEWNWKGSLEDAYRKLYGVEK